MDYSRHRDLFNPEEFNKSDKVTVIGAGATGSWLVLALAKLGITDITVYDFDTVEEHNLPNQCYGLPDVNKQKLIALRDMVHAQTGITIGIKDEKFINQRVSGYVFNLVDTMKDRETIWAQAIKYKTSVKLYVEPRLGMDGGQIYAITPINRTHIEQYENTFYSDEDSEVSACGHSLSVITSSLAIVSTCVRTMIEHFNGRTDVHNSIMLDFKYNNLVAYEW